MATKAVEKPETLASAMAGAFAEIEAATKDANNPHFKSKYADLGAVIEAVKPALINHGLFFTQHCHPSEDGVIVETILGHASGEEKSLGKLFVPANKRDAQGFGSALTYCRRYSLMTAFGVPTEDDDGNAARATNGNGHAKSTNGKISDAQYSELIGRIEGYGVDAQRFCEYLGVPSVKDIPSAKFAQAVAALEQKNPAKKTQPVKEAA